MLELATRPPAEAIGFARAFRNRVAAENTAYLQMSWRLVEPLEARIKRYPLRNFRPEMLHDFERAWRQDMPQVFSIDLVTEWPRHGVTITESRLTVAEFHDDGWREDYHEPEVSIGAVTVTLNRKVAKVTFSTKAIVSLNALAQRIRWGWESDDAALIRDIVALDDFDVAAIPNGQHVTIPVADGAGWRARAVQATINDSRTEWVIAVRDWWA